MLRINYYISGHGYGHATRSAQLISALLSSSPTTHVTIITTAPTHLFPTSSRISFVSQEVDSAIIQPQPYTIDAVASFAHLSTFLQKAETPEWQAKMDGILEETKCNLVLADAPCPIAWKGAKRMGIKCVLVSNFTFDAIFGKLLTFLPETERREEEWELVRGIQMMYTEYDYVVRLPGYISFPFVDNYWSAEEKKGKVLDAPLVFRPPRRGREEVLAELGVPKEMIVWKVLLVQFGGQILEKGSDTRIPNLPEGWICLSSEEIPDERFFRFPKDVYSPDLVSAADVVLGKIGYGTVSECVGMGKALVYVLRPMFAEEPGLLKYMTENGTCQEISVAEYECGDWTSTIERVFQARKATTKPRINEGSAKVAKMIEALLK